MSTNGTRQAGMKRLVAAVGAGVVATSLPLIAAPHAAAAPGTPDAAKAWDFDGDGQRDLAIGVSGENENAGAVVVIRGGGPKGVRTGSAVKFSQDTRGVPGTSEAGDAFGSALASGDFDGDGFADLAVAASSEDLGKDPETGADAGQVTVIYGGENGLRPKSAERINRADSELGTSDRQESRFGFRLAAADFEADGRDDLVITSAAGSGGVLVYRGRASGVSELPSRQIYADHGLPDEVSGVINSLATGDLDDNGVPDLALGMPEFNFAYGAAVVIYAAAGEGLDAAGDEVPAAQVWTQDTDGVADVAGPLDAFGAAVGIGDVSGDGRKDLVVSAVQEPNETPGVTGALHVLRGSKDGVTAKADQYVEHDQLVDDPHGALGDQLDVGRLDDTRRADIAVSAASTDALGNRWGRVLVVHGHADGIGAGRIRSFTQDTGGIAGGQSPTADYWGEVIEIRDVGRSSMPDLLVADMRELVQSENEVGRVNILWGSRNGLSGERSRSLTQNTDGIPGVNEAGDRFGSAL